MKENNLKKILKASYKPQAEASADIEKLGYKYDPELSTMENKVFYDPKTGKASIAYRGSTTSKDWIANLKQAIGFTDKEGEKRIQLADQVKKKYESIDTIYGHSRGGLIAEKAGDRTGAKVITYNKATLPEDIFKSVRPEQTDIRTKGDIVSLPSIFQSGGVKKEISSLSPFQNFITSHSTSNL